jgi:hypothetical protein
MIFSWDDFLIGAHRGDNGADISSGRLHFGADVSSNLCFGGCEKRAGSQGELGWDLWQVAEKRLLHRLPKNAQIQGTNLSDE